MGFRIVLLTLLVMAAPQAAGVPDLQVDRLATGAYSRMHMLLEKTIFAFDVLTVDVRFDRATQQRFQRLAGGHGFSPQLAGQIAGAAAEADEVFVKLEFQRTVSLDRWVQGVRESLEKGWRAGLIQEETYRHVSDSLPIWFRGVARRGFEKGDQLLYRGYPDRLRTVLVSNGGTVLLDQTDHGSSPKRALLAGYFAPETDFRDPLIRSVLEDPRTGVPPEHP